MKTAADMWLRVVLLDDVSPVAVLAHYCCIAAAVVLVNMIC